MIALALICFLQHLKPSVASVIAATPVIEKVLQGFKKEELLSDNFLLRQLFQVLCTEKEIGYQICGHRFFFALGGSDPDELEHEFSPVIRACCPLSHQHVQKEWSPYQPSSID
ncbi:unnamed protein product [Parnassius apollo]|uniref:(apollo) hypothetical protein n=1 Tax=Parnassius apollo TaxID=110799 RepID=A0A8S3XRD7_PARAO|nr:unnamed protein product [Parnassius apollo]